MKKDIAFYNRESGSYSEKRYLGAIDNFIKYFFHVRLSLFLSFLQKELLTTFTTQKITLLDIGCADGFVMEQASHLSPASFQRLVGIDTSPAMIEEAENIFGDKPSFAFFERGQELQEQFDVIVELGVPLSDWREEFRYVLSRLKEHGVYIVSTPGSKNSLYSRIKKDFHSDRPLSFGQFDALAEEFFDIREAQQYAFFIPLLWRFPRVAKMLQPFLEKIFSFLLPHLCHEKMYVLRKKRNGSETSIPASRHTARFLLVIRYLFAGFLSFASNISLLFIFTQYFHWWYLLASTVAFIISVVVSFLAQKFITFRDRTVDRVPRETLWYSMIALWNVCANALMMYAFVDGAHIPYLLAQVLSAGIIALWSLFLYRYIVFPHAKI